MNAAGHIIGEEGSPLTVHDIDPLRDPRWQEFLKQHPRASVFHTPEWLEALHRTYGYEAVAVTTSAPGEDLRNGLVFCRIKSWLTGRRLVSLPFSDHCEPLVDSSEELGCLVSALKNEAVPSRAKYVEIRPVTLQGGVPADMSQADSFCLHRVDLRPSLDEIFRGFHRDCVQRKIQRAERDGLVCEQGRAEALLQRFYSLMVLTRRRQQLPPQPLAWFRNLIACLGDRLEIHLASKDGRPVAGILTLRHKGTLVYKYGASDDRFNNLGSTQMLFWKAIQEAKGDGLLELDMGRSDWDNPGLIAFKDRWGANRSALTYLRYPARQAAPSAARFGMRIAKQMLGLAPNGVLTATGRVLYRHFG